MSKKYFKRNARMVYLFDEIDFAKSQSVIEKLLELDDECNADIFLMINTVGGYTSAGQAICDVIKGIHSRVIAICTGNIFSMGAVVAASCDYVYGTKHATFMIHDTNWGMDGSRPEHKSKLKGCDIVSKHNYEILSAKTGLDVEYLMDKSVIDWYFDVNEAQKIRLVDTIIDDNYLLPYVSVPEEVEPEDSKISKTKK